MFRTPKLPPFCLLAVLVGTLSCSIDGSFGLPSAEAEPQTPVFADNYRVCGVISLPYAELNEPFNAFYDKPNDRSRTDYFGTEYQVFQFGPKASPSRKTGNDEFGSVYKLLYVPKDFRSPSEKKESRIRHLIKEAVEPFKKHNTTTTSKLRVDDLTEREGHVTAVKRVCFGAKGGVGYTISPQSVLPSLSDYEYDSSGRCPHVSEAEHRHATCELWKFTSQVGDKKNIYKFWIRRDEQNKSIPVYYYMLGYDSLLGSHFDRYDIVYFNYSPNVAVDKDFELGLDSKQCGPMPGPGDSHSNDENDNDTHSRASLSAINPIHAYIVQPHRYDHIDYHFELFKSKYANALGSKKFLSEQDERVGWFNFMHNLRFIHGKNRELRDYKLAVNQFAADNIANLRYLRGRLYSQGYNGGLDYAQHHSNLKQHSSSGRPLPDTFDWTNLGAVTPVKDQAICGSCWSFGTTGTLEGNYFVKTGKLLKLSQQQLIDCSWQYGNNGCDGGEDSRAYNYIKKAGGIATEEDYGHYRAIDGKCHDKDVERPVKIRGFYNVTTNSVDALKHAIVNYGPVSISIDASPRTFSFYSHGAYYDPKCQNSPDSLDHSVLAVGYTTIEDKLVWKVKNSWSTYWGNNGYIFIAAKDNNCGVLDAPTVPIIEV